MKGKTQNSNMAAQFQYGGTVPKSNIKNGGNKQKLIS